MKKLILFILICIVYLFTAVKVNAQAIDVNSDAPNTTNVVNDALAGGATTEEAAQAGADYLNSVGFDASVSTNPDGSVSIVCDNGSLVIVPDAPDMTTVYTDDPFPPLPPPSDGPIAPPGNPSFDPVPDNGSTDEPQDDPPPMDSIPASAPSACGVISCNPADPSICQRAGCAPCNATTRTCQPPSGGSCNGPCTTQSDCSARGGSTCQCFVNTNGTPGSSCQAPVRTGNSRCECDGMFSTPITAGGTITITAFTKATGSDASLWRLNSMMFRMFESERGSIVIRQVGTPQPAAITKTVNTLTLVRWMAVGSLIIPTDPTKEYRIQAVRDCRKSRAAVPDEEFEKLVLKKSSNTDKTIYGYVKNVIDSVLGISSYIVVPAAQAQGDQLQLGTFLPSKTVINSCEFIRFAL